MICYITDIDCCPMTYELDVQFFSYLEWNFQEWCLFKILYYYYDYFPKLLYNPPLPELPSLPKNPHTNRTLSSTTYIIYTYIKNIQLVWRFIPKFYTNNEEVRIIKIRKRRSWLSVLKKSSYKKSKIIN